MTEPTVNTQLRTWDEIKTTTDLAMVERAVAAVLAGQAENDAFNQLVAAVGIDPVAVGWLRAWFRYLRQAGVTYSIPTFVQALRGAPDVTRSLIALFRALHDPDAASADAAQAAREAGFSDCTPGRFLMPGDLAGSPALTFAPLPINPTVWYAEYA